MGISLKIRISETKSNQAALSSKGFPLKFPFLVGLKTHALIFISISIILKLNHVINGF